jgi:hypothetical protein
VRTGKDMIRFKMPLEVMDYWRAMGPIEQAEFEKAAVISGTSGLVLLYKVLMDFMREYRLSKIVNDPAAPAELRETAEYYLSNSSFLKNGSPAGQFYYNLLKSELEYFYSL